MRHTQQPQPPQPAGNQLWQLQGSNERPPCACLPTLSAPCLVSSQNSKACLCQHASLELSWLYVLLMLLVTGDQASKARLSTS